jgi:carbamoyl-phosphate synthase small subunit
VTLVHQGTGPAAADDVVDGLLVLADGTVFEGELIGRTDVVTTGEVVFNTALSGYQEIASDPSYAGQIITFTYPHIGSYGTNADDDEAASPACRGVIVRDLVRRPSNWRSDDGLPAWLARHDLAGIAGIDTRRLTRHLRDAGAIPGAFGRADGPDAAGRLAEVAGAATSTDGVDLTAEVTTTEPYVVEPLDEHRFTVVAYDFGIKRTILRHLARVGCRVEVVPASTTAAEVLARGPDGVFLSNGPGDPAAVAGGIEAIRGLVGRVPVFGICLGHQLLSLALGAETFKLPFGHHGGNHPVQHVASGRVEVTAQNHNYAVDPDSLAGIATVTHRNLNDGTNEGMRVLDAAAFSVQYHPEAGPGPHDAVYLFDDFVDLMDASRGSGS